MEKTLATKAQTANVTLIVNDGRYILLIREEWLVTDLTEQLLLSKKRDRY